jgi:hypothetical protein
MVNEIDSQKALERQAKRLLELFQVVYNLFRPAEQTFRVAASYRSRNLAVWGCF